MSDCCKSCRKVVVNVLICVRLDVHACLADAPCMPCCLAGIEVFWQSLGINRNASIQLRLYLVKLRSVSMRESVAAALRVRLRCWLKKHATQSATCWTRT